MDELGDLLGHRDLTDGLFRSLAARGARCWLKGPSGVGKTTIAHAVAEQWSAHGGDVYWLAGEQDEASVGRPAAYRALKARDPNRAVLKTVGEEATEPLRDVPFVGNTLAALARVLIVRFESQGPDFLTSEQQDLLAGFERASLSESVLFVVDDVNVLDRGSAELLQLMRRNDAAEVYSFIRRSSFLFVETLDQSSRLAPELLNALRRDASAHLSVPFPTWDVYPDVLKALGLRRSIDVQTCRKLYSLTRGHLKLAREIVRILDEGEIESALGTGRKAATVDELAAALLRVRLSSLSQPSENLERLLAIAACIGRSFSRQELECAFAEPQNFVTALDLAQREEYITGTGDLLQFTHEVVQAALRYLESSETANYHDRLAECVRHLRPGDYLRRFAHSARTRNSRRTKELLFAALLQEARGEAIIVREPMLRDTDVGELGPALTAARGALEAMDRGRHAEAIRLLVPFYDGTKSLAQGEIAYLLALNYYKGRTTPNYQSARAILDSWVGRREEGELWFRLMLTLAVVEANLDDRRSAAEVLRRVRTYLDRTSEHDPMARAKIQVLNRKAEIFYPVEIAGQLIQHAVDYFSPSAGGRAPRNAFQYSAALVNLSGNLYLRGEFNAAADTAARAIQCLAELSGSIRLVEPYKAFNNYAIAAFRSGRIPAAQAAEVLGALVGEPDDAQRLDRSLVSTNLGALLLLSGETETGCRLLERTYATLSDSNADGYYLFFAASNLAAARHLAGRTEEARELFEKIDSYSGDLPSEFLACIKLHVSALRKALTDPSCREATSLDRFPRVSFGDDGPHVTWRSLGWGLIMSDIQVWSDS